MPVSDTDLFSDATLSEPYAPYAALREAGPAVWLSRHQAWAVTGYAEVKQVLEDTETFSSVDGVALTDLANQQFLAGTVLASDGANHARLRRPLSRQLNPRAMRSLAERIRRQADDLVVEYVNRGRFDAVELATRMVADVVMELMGLPDSTRGKVLEGAAATFDLFGPDNERYQRSAPIAGAMLAFLHEEVSRDTVRPGSWMSAIYQAVDDGRLEEADCVPLMSAYTTAGMDTTIHGLSTAIHLLATHPAQWAALRASDASSENAFHETIRYDAPVQGFGRRATRDTHIGGTAIAANDQLWVSHGASGRDPRKWGADADSFRVDRADAAEHLALGSGPHSCAGNHLAALEAGSLLSSLVDRCVELELDGEPVRALNNVLRGWHSLPVRVAPAG
ncbi:hypothetical protein AN216_00735 [Streptomyces oceani]|uniref:Cytochrome n=1 Tax=Streptomyces oceani TaxID=1075402 RepID=A0A1E7KQ08_9ACTN|nr:hypothetical protein AN216_00735 [Streptomyces oceani]